MLNKIKTYIDNTNILTDYILLFNFSTIIFILYSLYALISLVVKSNISILNFIIIFVSLCIDVYAIINIELNSKYETKKRKIKEENMAINTSHTLA